MCSTARGRRASGPAYMAAFNHALDAGADLLVQMDADFSHDPADIPRLPEAAEGADRDRLALRRRGAAGRTGAFSGSVA